MARWEFNFLFPLCAIYKKHVVCRLCLRSDWRNKNQIHVNSPADYEKGIAGIGIGIDYLIRNNFLIVEDVFVRILIKGCFVQLCTILGWISACMTD